MKIERAIYFQEKMGLIFLIIDLIEGKYLCHLLLYLGLLPIHHIPILSFPKVLFLSFVRKEHNSYEK